MRASVVCAVALAVAAAVAGPAALPASADSGRPEVAFSFQDSRIKESSGIAASRRHPGVYWTHNDSSDGPYVYAVDGKGRTVARVTLRGIDPRDVEAISIGPDDQIYVGDIGDNLGGTWPEVWIYRFTEPKVLKDTTVDAVRYRVQYRAGPRNAEAMMVDPVTGRVYIASKKEGGGGLYRGPRTLSESRVNVFRRVADVPWVTDGSFSPDGSRLVLRGYFWAAEYRWKNGVMSDRKSLPLSVQPQGEGVTFGADGRSVLFSSEGEGSEVLRVGLGGDMLPDDAAKESSKPGRGHKDAGADGDQGSGSTAKIGLAVVVAALLAFFGLRRARRK
ncbi:hypothetical protein [Wenjunlia tyrosinilytica]|uniref:WD40 repeat domain-containing protein n=1 Tax=Wenjunlia tyrosinilytica TaxID=1544741 RepID=A0A917ZM66_9ACTN|nr:hypothetical protein [Wenjunlia tyrosinilytica]GGO86900.1 hypothetical protein GCM10012280_24120 [Wenjunlia tyrosinilytica]